MIGRLVLALALLVAAGSSLRAQAFAPPSPKLGTPNAPLTVGLGPLGTGPIVEGVPVGSVGLFHSDLATVVQTSPEAARYAQVFARNQMIGRPLVLVGAAAIVGGFAAYIARNGQVGMGGREAGALAVGTGLALYGVHRLTTSSRALSAAIAAYNRDRAR